MPQPPKHPTPNRQPDGPGRRIVPGLATRRLAVDILSAVTEYGRPLDQELESRAASPAFRALEPNDRALMRALVGTTLRRLGEIDDILEELMARPLSDKANRVRQILRLGAAQLLFLDIPDHAAVSLAVELADEDHRVGRGFKGLVNGVLRTLARARDEILDGRDADRLDTPDWLWQRWLAHYGEATTRAIAAKQRIEPYLDISVKSDAERWAGDLGGLLLPTGSIRLEGAGAVEKLAGFAEGAWWVQDAAAALPARLFGDVAGLDIADLCAAPGGKTAALAAAGARVTAVDISAERLKRLATNIERLKLQDVSTVAADLERWDPGRQFDGVLLDAPCSATGTIRRHPDVALSKTEAQVGDLAALQSRLIARASDWVKPGGMFVYCTCSLEPEEGEAQIDAFLARRPDFALVPVVPAEIGGLAEVITPSGTLRTLPSHLDNEDPRLAGLDGFFIARLKRVPAP
ncbi:MAG: transcription antitermination factor NusB [Ancalomicrobiaceae bacterium]|nr:transcription antitermination factor NusB [Ancalomicrobiaceae bacterium]